jgi:predicted  nucleic acid-binding Zn-ribbon protein
MKDLQASLGQLQIDMQTLRDTSNATSALNESLQQENTKLTDDITEASNDKNATQQQLRSEIAMLEGKNVQLIKEMTTRVDVMNSKVTGEIEKFNVETKGGKRMKHSRRSNRRKSRRK